MSPAYPSSGGGNLGLSIWNPSSLEVFAFSKGRVALYAILRAAGIGPGDEVLLPGFTCVVVPAAVQYTGAHPVYYDIDPATLNGDPAAAAAKITPRTKAILLQHTFGMPADPGDLVSICRKLGIVLIEDCAHALGSLLGSLPVGTIGDAAFCSLQWSKPVTTGLGGLARVNRPRLQESLTALFNEEFQDPARFRATTVGLLSGMYSRFFRPSLYWLARDSYHKLVKFGLVQGSSSEQELVDPSIPAGYRERFGGMRLKQIHQALGSAPDTLKHRRKISEIYAQRLQQWGSFLQQGLPSAQPVYLRFPLLVENRQELLRQARKLRIEIGDWFNAPLHPSVADPGLFGYAAGMCPNAELASRMIINLPTHRHVSVAEATRVLNFLATRKSDIACTPVTAGRA